MPETNGPTESPALTPTFNDAANPHDFNGGGGGAQAYNPYDPDEPEPSPTAPVAAREVSEAPVEPSSRAQAATIEQVRVEEDFEPETYESSADEYDPLPGGPVPTESEARQKAEAERQRVEAQSAAARDEAFHHDLNAPRMRDDFTRAASPEQREEIHEEGGREEKGEQSADHDLEPEFDGPSFDW